MDYTSNDLADCRWIHFNDPVTKLPTISLLVSQKAFEVYERTGLMPRRMNATHIRSVMNSRAVLRAEF